MSEDNDLYDHELVRFVFDLRKDDPLGMIVRAQARIEHALRQFVASNARSPQHVDRADLEFEEVLRLALILGLNSEIKPALSALAALQRKFVRDSDAEFSRPDADNFYNALGPELKGLLREVYEEFRMKENLPLFKRQLPSTRLVWYLIGIWSAILAYRKHGPSPSLSTAVQFPARYVERTTERREHFLQLLDAGDDFQLVVRGHSHLDHELREFIAAAAPQPAAVNSRNDDYAGALRLALALGLDLSLEEGLTAVGTLRNKFAHRYEVELSEQDAKKIYEKIGCSRQADAEQAWAATFLKRPHEGRPANLRQAPARDLVAISMAMLFSDLLLQQLELRTAALRRETNGS